MQPDDDDRLWHMLDAARDACRFMAGKTRADLDSDRLLLLGVAKAIEMIGEAAFKVSDAGRARIPSLPWPKIIGMRHILVHDYFRFDLNIICRTVQNDLPVLISQLESLNLDDANSGNQ